MTKRTEPPPAEELRKLIEKWQSEGWSRDKMASELGVTSRSLLRWMKQLTPDLILDRGERITEGQEKSESETMGEDERQRIERETEERIDQKRKVERVTQAYDQVNDRLSKIEGHLAQLTRRPLEVVPHGESADVSCPTCGTHAAVRTGFDPEGDFDRVVHYLGMNHKRSPTGKALDCPDCAPKLIAELKEQGYVVQKVPPVRK